MMTEAFLRSLTAPELMNYLDGRTLNPLETAVLLSKSKQMLSEMERLEDVEGTVNSAHEDELNELQEQLDDETTEKEKVEKDHDALLERVKELESELADALEEKENDDGPS
jgi:chromosome segregation ATPase